MKIACLLSKGEGDKYHNHIKSAITKFIPRLGNYDLVYDAWGKEGREEFSKILLDIEKNGPEVVEIPDEFFANHKDAEIVIGSFTPFSEKSLNLLENAKVLGVMRAGMENINLNAATERGIAVLNAAGRNADAVSDFAVGMMLSETRNIARAFNGIKNGQWPSSFPNSAFIPDMRGKTIGLFGFGQIGSKVAEKLSGFHVNVIVYDPFVSEELLEKYNCKGVSKEELFENADIISVHARLTEDTKRIIGKDDFARMKSTAVFINTARSGLVDYDALYEVLKDRKITGAALDVFDDEPLLEDSPFLALDNVTLTSHIAGQTKDSGENTIRLVIDGFYDLIANGDNSRVVNKEVTETEEFKEWVKKAREDMGL